MWNRSGSQAIAIQRIRDLDLRDVLERYGVEFNRTGAALCPFHNEDTPSFKVKGRKWKCFGCNKSGDALDFVRERFNVSLNDAIEIISNEYGFGGRPLSVYEIIEADKRKVQRNERKKLKAETEAAYLDALIAWTDAYWELREYGNKSIDDEIYVDLAFKELDLRLELNLVESKYKDAYGKDE